MPPSEPLTLAAACARMVLNTDPGEDGGHYTCMILSLSLSLRGPGGVTCRPSSTGQVVLNSSFVHDIVQLHE